MLPKPVTPGAAAAAYWGRWFVCTLLHGLLVMLLLAAGTATAAPTTPTEDFTDNGDGTVTHRVTGLTWMRCAMGMTWTGTDCTGTANTYTWEQATALTANFAGKSDWRLPSIAELNTIVEREAYDPAINSEVFPGTPHSEFWSETPSAVYSGFSWSLNFSYGFAYNFGLRSDHFKVRLVRGSPPFDPLASYTPSADFYDNGDGTVTHIKTGLMWKRCAEGQTWIAENCSGNLATYDWSTAVHFTSDTAGHSDWRLPLVNELLTISEYRRSNPAINTIIFPNQYSSEFREQQFWTNSRSYGHNSLAYSLSISDGAVYNGTNQSEPAAVRLVRSGQFFSSRGFTNKSAVAPRSFVTSETLKVFAATSQPISIVGGSYSINGGEYAANPGTINPLDAISVRMKTGDGFTTTTRMTLTIGSVSGNFAATTVESSDVNPPNTPGAPRITVDSLNTINVTWSPATNLETVSHYLVYRNDRILAQLENSNSYTDSGLTPATSYVYQIAACNTFNNCSARSAPTTGVTPNARRHVPTTPTSDFDDNGDGTVTHRRTGLMWMRCLAGMSWTGSGCEGSAEHLGWQDAIKYKVTFANRDDWRLPTIAELHTILESDMAQPAINTDAFPMQTAFFQLWSVTANAFNSSHVWAASFDGVVGSSSSGQKDGFSGCCAMRFVRNGGAFIPTAPYAPSIDFFDHHDGTVTHLKTGLMWKRCTEGQLWDGNICIGDRSVFDWGTAIHLTSNSAGHDDWRLPTTNQLLSIIEYQSFNPALNTAIFPESPNTYGCYWTGSPGAANSGGAPCVEIIYGSQISGNWNRGGLRPARLVRSGPFFSPLGFPSKISDTVNTVVTSSSLKIAPFGGSLPISITNGQYSINNADYTSNPGTVNPSDSISVSVTSAGAPGAIARTTLSVGAIRGDFVVANAEDALAPTIPAALTSTVLGPTQLRLTWSASTDNTGVTSYRLYRNGTLLTTTTDIAHVDTLLGGSGPFVYTVEACDAASNCSALSSAVTFIASAAAPSTTPKLSVGMGHSGGIHSDGRLLMWGINEAGQLGLGVRDGTPRSAPQTIAGSGYAQMAAGGSHSAAVKQDTSLWTWGGNASGQLGNGTTVSSYTPIQIGTGYATVTTGNAHTLAIKTGSDLWAWGNNGNGQLGDGTNLSKAVPTRIGSDFYAVSAGTSHSMAIKLDGGLWAWGSNNFGQLGDETGYDRYAPNLIGYGYTAVAAGAFHTLALKSDGSLWAWGKNDVGQLGDGSIQNRYAPVQIGTGFTAVSAGSTHSLALKADGTLWAWGANDSGQLGSANYVGARSPQRLAGATDVTAIAAGGHTSLALKRDGSVLSWGANNTGQLGDGTLGERSAPVLVVSPGVDGYLNLTASATAAVAANLRVPFFVSVSGAINAQTATVRSTTRFAQTDLGQSGAVFVVARVPVDALGAVLGSNTSAPVARTPRAAGESTSVLVQLTASGWRAVVNGQLIPYASGVLGEQTAAQNILDNTDTSTLAGAEFCVGYGRSADEMVGAGRMRVVATIPGLSAAGVTSASCLMGASTGSNHSALAADADAIFGWAERTYPQYFSPANQGSQSVSAHRYRAYNDGHYLAVNESGEAHLYYLGPLSAQVFLDLGLLVQWLTTAGL